MVVNAVHTIFALESRTGNASPKRRHRLVFGCLAFLAIALIVQLGAATVASAASTTGTAGTAGTANPVTCKQYDRYVAETPHRTNVRVCIAKSKSFPQFSGGGVIINKYSTGPNSCGFALLQFDIDDLRPAVACTMQMPPVLPTWKWNGSGWDQGASFYPGERVWTAPYKGGWRWVWTARSGWNAIEETHVAFRWFA